MNIVLFFSILIFTQFGWGYMEFPKNCLMSNDPNCHFGTLKKSSLYEQDGMKLFLGEKTLLKKQKNLVEWVYGPVLFEIEAKTEIKYKNSTITLQKGQYLFFGEEAKLKVEVLEGNLKLERYEVTEGFQASFNSFESSSVELEPLQAIDLHEHLVRYIRLKNLNREQAQSYIDEFSPKHKNYVDWVSELNQNLIKRSIAHDERVRKHESEIRDRARLAQEKRKRDFFNKVFER